MHYFAVMKGDSRQSLLCDLLIADGHAAQLIPEPEKWDRENLPPPGAILLTAKATEKLQQKACENGFSVMEYGKHPGFLEENGAITAECALRAAMEHRLRTIRGSNVLVIGLGHIGKPLVNILLGLQAEKVSAAVRRKELYESLQGSAVTPVRMEELPHFASEYDLIFNTAPDLVLPKTILSLLRPDVLIVDLASKPGGVDWEAARQMQLKTVHALALPGKFAPLSGAIAIRRAVYSCYEEAVL